MTQYLRIFLSLLLLLHSSLSIVCLSNTTPPNRKPFTLKAMIMHRNARGSPLHDPFATDDAVFQSDMEYARQRAAYYFGNNVTSKFTNSIHSETKITGPSFVMMFKIGTPPTETFGYIDTGSSLSWVQCEPCMFCFKQNGTRYNMDKSSSYESVPWGDPFCHNTMIGGTVDDLRDNCSYLVRYSDMTISADEDYMPPGRIGLGRRPVSLIHQLQARHFMYSVQHSGSISEMVGQIIIGITPLQPKNQIPLLPPSADNDLYRLAWKSIKVAGFNLDFAADFYKQGIVIDSGSTFTVLPESAFDVLKKAITKKMGEALKGMGSRFCYESLVNAPAITFEFVNYKMRMCNADTWKPTEDRSAYCLTMTGSPNSASILGMYQQRNKKIIYDLEVGFVSIVDVNGYCPLMD